LLISFTIIITDAGKFVSRNITEWCRAVRPSDLADYLTMIWSQMYTFAYVAVCWLIIDCSTQLFESDPAAHVWPATDNERSFCRYDPRGHDFLWWTKKWSEHVTAHERKTPKLDLTSFHAITLKGVYWRQTALHSIFQITIYAGLQ
jgi:hypothetical protein